LLAVFAIIVPGVIGLIYIFWNFEMLIKMGVVVSKSWWKGV